MKTIVVLLVLAGLASNVHGQPTSSSVAVVQTAAGESDLHVEEARLCELAQEWRRIYNGTDAGRFSTLYAENAEYISGHVPGLVASGRDRIIANFQKGMDSGGHLDSVEVLSVNLSCELATLVCRYEATNSGQKVTGRNLLVVKRVNGRWLIVTHMTVV